MHGKPPKSDRIYRVKLLMRKQINGLHQQLHKRFAGTFFIPSFFGSSSPLHHHSVIFHNPREERRRKKKKKKKKKMKEMTRKKIMATFLVEGCGVVMVVMRRAQCLIEAGRQAEADTNEQNRTDRTRRRKGGGALFFGFVPRVVSHHHPKQVELLDVSSRPAIAGIAWHITHKPQSVIARNILSLTRSLTHSTRHLLLLLRLLLPSHTHTHTPVMLYVIDI